VRKTVTCQQAKTLCCLFARYLFGPGQWRFQVTKSAKTAPYGGQSLEPGDMAHYVQRQRPWSGVRAAWMHVVKSQLTRREFSFCRIFNKCNI